MRALKVIGLGMLFSFIGFIAVIFISIMGGRATSEPSHATALSALLVIILFNPITWLVVVVAFGAAMWLTRKTVRSGVVKVGN